jgi:hypothetical protein
MSFEYKYLYKEMQPFFSSEPVPSELNPKCSKLVGQNLGEFLRSEERIKVVLLYHLHEHCTNCDEVV